MSKAKDLALEKYPPHSVLIVPARGRGYYADSHLREGFIEGYHQAEKDLDVVSWVKEVSGVKELNRAEEEALKAYPPRSILANYDTINRRDAFEYGYLKAEKDLELSWEDMRIILDAENDILRECNSRKELVIETYPKEEDYYGEILKRFKDYKERKEQ